MAATYSRHNNQELLQAAVTRGGGKLVVVRCDYQDTEEEVLRRVRVRLSQGAVGGCRLASHYFDDKGRYEGIKLPHIVVSMDGGEHEVHHTVQAVLAYARR